MNEADELDDDLRDLAALWQRAAAPEVDAAALRRQLLRERLSLLAELLLCAAGFAIGLLAAVDDMPAPGVAAMLFSLGAAGAALLARRGVNRALLKAVAPQLHTRYATQQRRLRTAWAGVAVIAMALLFLAALLVIDDGAGALAQRPWSIAAALLFSAAAMVLAVRKLVRAAIERERLASLLRASGDGSAAADSGHSPRV